MKKHNLAFVDTETTGFNPDTQELIQIGCVIMEQDWSTGKCVLKHVDEFELKIKPEHIETADAQALRVNGYEPADWIFAYTLKEAMQIFAEKTKDAIFVAHNACFDYMFIEKAFRLADVKNEMHYHKLDTIAIAFAKFHNTDDVDKFSLRNLCEYFKIENKNAHTALSDARALAEVYEKLMQIKG